MGKLKAKREVERFEHKPSYYIDTFINGNKSHLMNELREFRDSLPELFTILCVEIALRNKQVARYIVNHL